MDMCDKNRQEFAPIEMRINKILRPYDMVVVHVGHFYQASFGVASTIVITDKYRLDELIYPEFYLDYVVDGVGYQLSDLRKIVDEITPKVWSIIKPYGLVTKEPDVVLHPLAISYRISTLTPGDYGLFQRRLPNLIPESLY